MDGSRLHPTHDLSLVFELFLLLVSVSVKGACLRSFGIVPTVLPTANLSLAATTLRDIFSGSSAPIVVLRNEETLVSVERATSTISQQTCNRRT